MNKTKLILFFFSFLSVYLIGCNLLQKTNYENKSLQKKTEVIDLSQKHKNIKKKKSGKYYKDDGPPQFIPSNLMEIPNASPKIEPIIKSANRPYRLFNKNYFPITNDLPFIEIGIGSWYGKKFHGNPTASGEIYDMFKMTAAHPTLPIPSYAKVKNIKTGKEIIVKINDRGPFISGRIIDLSFVAALKLGYVKSGTAKLEVKRILPREIIKSN